MAIPSPKLVDIYEKEVLNCLLILDWCDCLRKWKNNSNRTQKPLQDRML